MKIDLNLEERTELRLAARLVLARDPKADGALISALQKLEASDHIASERDYGSFQSIGGLAKDVLGRVHSAIEEEREATETAVAALGDRLAVLSRPSEAAE